MTRARLSLVREYADRHGFDYYKVPLYDDAFAELALPRDLTFADTVRLAAFVFALVADGEGET